ncbi:MAG: electron transfer flavoprotein subunit alpha/FixB family protein, partial [Lachnospiraceae bacterium]
GSQLMVEIVTNKRRPQMCTVRNGMFEKAEKDIMHKGLIFPVDVNLQSFDIHTKVVKKFKDTEEKFSLLDAKVVVAGGMGIGSKEGFKLLEQLAETLHGVVGGTRAVTAAEWIPHDRMIGQTGLVISPDLYIACGISGAIQHMLGVSGAKCVVAINNNPDAPIFKEADYGVVADYKDFIPKLIEKLKERKTF